MQIHPPEGQDTHTHTRKYFLNPHAGGRCFGSRQTGVKPHQNSDFQPGQMALCRIFTEGDMDAETALIKSILERHNYGYSVHDTTNPTERARMARLCGEGKVGPLVLVGRSVVWAAVEMPALDISGEILRTLQREHRARRAREEYHWGAMYLVGSKREGVRRDPFVALEWLRRSADKGDAKGQCALGSLLLSGEAGRWPAPSPIPMPRA